MNVRKLQFLLMTTILLCASISQAAPLQVTVSIIPQAYFIKKIGGDLVEVNVMVKPGSSPAIYEPQPRQMAKLSKAEIYFAIGVPFEQAWLPRFEAANPKLNVINLADSVVRHPMQTHLHDTDKHHEDEVEHTKERNDNFLADPHVWLSPPLVRVISMQIRDSLIDADPKNGDTYRANYYSFAEEIDRLDKELIGIFKTSKKHISFMTYHPSWGYFARAYGLNQIPIELEGKEPSPKQMRKIIDFAREESVSAIFIQPQFSRKSAQTIASSVNAKVLIADPLDGNWAENLRKTAETFRQNSR
ncbi:metal ABC transporter solute-binding protein, Zn/Mn family [Maridesulfovibrio frigidus]|uniref:metal ABC transporter solute-binding protein, Zn/Mn family n=1 Tax=Maridesulfovibrio frigidus TaxID=340956 RepID=UPI0004E0DA87|nr:zinc ABC transporter substrate-binding protein [Maridesulfovibrio frigidus]